MNRYRALWIILSFFACGSLSSYLSAQAPIISEELTPLVYSNGGKPLGRRQYEVELIEFLLAADDSPRYRLETLDQIIMRERMLSLLGRGKVDLVELASFSAEKNQAKTLHRVEYPVLNGLLGYRIGLIRKGDHNDFNQITTLDQLKSIRIGQGNWSEVPILEMNGLTIVKFGFWDELFPMLANNRFNFLSLGVMEAAPALAARPSFKDRLEIEKTLLLYYPFERNIFVAANKPKVAEKLRRGFEKIIEQGIYDRHFDRYFGDTVTQMRESKRRLIILRSPYVSEDHPLSKPILLQ